MSNDQLEPGQATRFHKRCANIEGGCHGWVHRHSKSCKQCGFPSPWTPQGQILAQNAFVVVEDFHMTVGIQFTAFTAGTVLRDVALIAQLLEADCPIKKLEDDDVIHTCPHCHKPSLVGGKTAGEQLDASGFPRNTGLPSFPN